MCIMFIPSDTQFGISHATSFACILINPNGMNITCKSYAVVIICLLASCFVCRNFSLGLCTEMNAEAPLL